MNKTVGNDCFYNDLQPLDNFVEISNPVNFVDVPEDWYIILTDVKGSTKAIEDGHYKDVNLVAASSVAAVINLTGEFLIPFVYGGDGATCLIPKKLVKSAKLALSHIQQISKKEFGLEIRVAFIPVVDLIQDGCVLKIAKLKISEHYNQAILEGDGIDRAEFLLKNEQITKYDLIPKSDSEFSADYTGLECRWQDIPSPKEETLALIVKILPTKNQHEILMKVLDGIEKSFGNDSDYRPLDEAGLHLTLELSRLNSENKLKTSGLNLIKKVKNLTWIWLVTLYGKFQETILKNRETMVKFKKTVTTITSDYKKYDGSLKMIISGTQQQRQSLEKFLEELYQKKSLIYGIHTTNRALITCLVSPKLDQEVHFIDAADGGYALAAKSLKSKL